jgi:hypothetical protein
MLCQAPEGTSGISGSEERSHKTVVVERKKSLMPPKTESTNFPLKVQIPKTLLKRIDTFWHQQELKNRKAAVVALLEQGLSNGNPPKQAEPPKDK